METWQIVLLILGVVLVALIFWVIGVYNRFVAMRNKVEEGWRQVDVELHRRYDLIPNLVETVRGYAAHEAHTLEAVIQARAAAVAPGTGRGQQAQQENMLSQALGRLMVVAEQYPELMANENFRVLMGQLNETENRIAGGRRYYNALVNDYNTKRETFPPSIVAGMFGFRRAEYFEAAGDARNAPRADFSSLGRGGSVPGGPGGLPQGGSVPGGPPQGAAPYGPPPGSPLQPPTQVYPQQGGQFRTDGYPPAGPPQQQ